MPCGVRSWLVSLVATTADGIHFSRSRRSPARRRRTADGTGSRLSAAQRSPASSPFENSQFGGSQTTTNNDTSSLFYLHNIHLHVFQALTSLPIQATDYKSQKAGNGVSPSWLSFLHSISTMTWERRRKSVVDCWRRRRIAVGSVWFALLVCDSRVLGFGRWTPFNFRAVNIDRRIGSLRDTSENYFPATTRVGLPTTNNVSRAVLLSAPTSSSPNFVSAEKLQELQDSVNIVSVIEAYGLPQFQRSGEFRATCLCPFHDDHNPSMSIDSARGIFKCFSCGAGGNVFSFVRDYAKLQGEEVSFYQAVKVVNDRFASPGNDAFALNLPPGMKEITLRDGSASTAFIKKNMTSTTTTKIFDTNKKRIILANAAAAAFFEDCLVTRASAGLARTHLRTRGMSPRTVRAFAIGYAPDAYFSNARKSGPQSWGEGGLVQHLQQKGFTTTEIVDAGLATVVKKESTRPKKQQEEKSETKDVPFSSLIDRFRGRLIVPIFDESGLQVLGFGGRILESSLDDPSPGNYTQPKYLNSPESPVFQKKNILFGQHMAQKALRFWDKEEGIPRAVVIVEGYMDAIALWQAGVREAVASMGTGLTTEQITAAAILAGSKNGRVIFCLDNDHAGIAATERLCRSGILSSVGESYPVEFRVARLPENVKDPADFVEMNRDSTKLDDLFRKEVLGDSSLEWTDWYQKHILDQYNQTAGAGESGSFADIMERLGGFLAMVRDEPDRNRRFRHITDVLAEIIAAGCNETEISETMRLQLEAELKRKTSMRARSNQGASFLASPNSATPRDDISRTLARMAPRNDPQPEFQYPKKRGVKNKKIVPQASLLPFENGYSSFEQEPATPLKSNRRFRAKNLAKKKPALTPHFSGFEFSNDNDKRWMDDLELMGKARASKSREDRDSGSSEIVYFNSNEYHGGNFITEEALSAGYSNGFVPRDPGLLTKGINSMVDLKEDQVLEAAENDLLRCLLQFPSARESLQRIIDVNLSSGSEDEIMWTHPEKLWLFRRLTSQDHDLKAFGRGNLIEFQSYLSSQQDALPGAISEPNEPEKSGLTRQNRENEMSPSPSFAQGDTLGHGIGGDGKTIEPASTTDVESQQAITPQHGCIGSSVIQQKGRLDHLFYEWSSAEDGFVLPEDKVALRAQEAYYTMLWSSAVQRLSRRKQELIATMAIMSPDTNHTTEGGEQTAETGMQLNVTLLQATIGQDAYQSLRADIQDAKEQVQLLSGALQGLSSRLIQKALPADGWHSRKINKDYQELSARLSQHMNELEKWSIPESEETIGEDEAYETMLEQNQLEWGDLYDDDRMWSSDDLVQSRLPPATTSLVQVGGDDESIDSFSERMEQEWGWLDKATLDNSDQSKKSGPYEFDEHGWEEYLAGT